MTPADPPSTVFPSATTREQVFQAHPRQVGAARAYLAAALSADPAALTAPLPSTPVPFQTPTVPLG